MMESKEHEILSRLFEAQEAKAILEQAKSERAAHYKTQIAKLDSYAALLAKVVRDLRDGEQPELLDGADALEVSDELGALLRDPLGQVEG